MTLAANQLLSEWKSKQLSWNEEEKQSPAFWLLSKAEGVVEDIEENIRNKKESHLSKDGVTTV